MRNSVLQNRSWNIGIVAHRLSKTSDHGLLVKEEKLFLAIFEYLINKLGKNEKEKILYGSLFILPYSKPFLYSGDTTPLLNSNEGHIELIRFNPKTEAIEVWETPPVFTFPLEFKEFGDKIPVIGY